jgi:hypothetical protein
MSVVRIRPNVTDPEHGKGILKKKHKLAVSSLYFRITRFHALTWPSALEQASVPINIQTFSPIVDSYQDQCILNHADRISILNAAAANYRVAAIFPEHFQSFTVALKNIFLN